MKLLDTIRQIARMAFCLALFFAFVGVLTACSKSGPYIPPPQSFQTPPTYPNAQQVQATPTLLDGYMSGTLVTYHTNESPESVLSFYEKKLISDGWALSASKPGTSMRFHITGGCPIYVFEVDVITDANPGGFTTVELRTGKDLCL
jgi:predicted small lipoprotein YifL